MSDHESDADDVGTVGFLVSRATPGQSQVNRHADFDANSSEADSEAEVDSGLEQRESQLASMEEMCDLAEKEKLAGNKLFQRGQHLGAYSAYQSGIDIFGNIEPHNLSERARRTIVALYCNSAQAMLKRPSTPGATTLWARLMADKALELDPENVKALFRRGCAHSNAKEWSLARDDFEHVLRLTPNNEAARVELHRVEEALIAAEAPLERAEQEKIEGNHFFQTGNYKESYEAFSRGIEVLECIRKDKITPQEQALLVTLCSSAAQVMLKSDEVDKALELVEKALAIDPTDVKALYRRGHAYSKSQKWTLARRDFQYVLELDPKHEAASQALQKMQIKVAKSGGPGTHLSG